MLEIRICDCQVGRPKLGRKATRASLRRLVHDKQVRRGLQTGLVASISHSCGRSWDHVSQLIEFTPELATDSVKAVFGLRRTGPSLLVKPE